MKHISDYRKIEENISRFNSLVGELEHTNDSISQMLESVGPITEAADTLSEINNKFSGMKKVNVKNLEALLKTQTDFPDNTNFEELYKNLAERIFTMKEISKRIKTVTSKVKKLELKVDELFEDLDKIKIDS